MWRGGQTSGYIAKLRLRWHPDLDVIRTVAEFVNFEIGYVGHQCGSSRADWTDANLFYWQISFPFLSVLACGAWWLFRAGLRWLQRTSWGQALFGTQEEAEVRTVRVVKNKSALASVSHTSANLVDYVSIKFLMFFVTWCCAPSSPRNRTDARHHHSPLPLFLCACRALPSWSHYRPRTDRLRLGTTPPAGTQC